MMKPIRISCGWSVVHSIIQDHDGRITIRSQPGQGTTVAIELPNL